MSLARIREGLDDACKPVLVSCSHAPLLQSSSISKSVILIDVIGEARGLPMAKCARDNRAGDTATLEATLYEAVISALATIWRCAVPSGYRLRQ
jgi:hypothetical protein